MNWKKTVCLLGAAFFCTSMLLADQPANSSLNAVAVQKAAIKAQLSVKPSATAAMKEAAGQPATHKPAIEVQKRALAGEGINLSNRAPLNHRGGCDVDFCVDAPYAGELASTCGAGDDCALRTTEEVEFNVAVPYAGTWTFSLCGSDYDTYLYLGTTACSQDIGANDDFCGLQSEITVYIASAMNVYATIEGFSGCGNYLLNVTEVIPPQGACCVDLVCVGTMTEPECQTAGGIFYQDEDCATFVCPIPGLGDFCDDPIDVTAPYPVTLDGTNIGMTLDCPGVLDWNAQWYYFELPYANNDVHITLTATGGDLGTAGIVLMNDCACDDYIIGSYTFVGAVIDLTWPSIAGPGYYYFPAYALDSGNNPINFTVTFDVTEHVLCDVVCPPGAVDEQEPCGTDMNGGCNMTVPTFNPINLDETVCGTIWADTSTRDTDWYEFVADGSKIYTFSVEAELSSLGVVCGLVATTPPGNPDCASATALDPYATGGECQPISITTGCLPTGTYWFFVSSASWGDLPCDSNNDYTATLTAVDCLVYGACCYNDGYDCVDNQDFECDALGGVWWVNETCATHVCETPCTEATINIEIHTDNYPSETTWDVTDYYTGAMLCSGGPYALSQHTYNEQCCVPFGGCYTFTIHDAFGDGICCAYGIGYYNVYYQDELICTGGEFGLEESCEMFGDNCVAPTGACCLDTLECVGTMTEDECTTAYPGARWYINEDCATFVCPNCDVDYCVDAPFHGEMLTTCGAGNDCALRTTEEVEYRVSVPEAGTWTFSLCGSAFDTYLYLGTTPCSQDLGANDDFCGLQSEITLYISGPMDVYTTIEGYSGCGDFVLNVTMQESCDVECPPGATPEGEPDCYDDYVDATNGGCNSSPFVFSPITCNETVCGASGTYLFNGSSYRDTDWYQIDLPAATTLTWDVCASFGSALYILDANQGGCDNIIVAASATGTPGILATATASVAPGTYWLFVAPSTFSGVPCGSPYVATLTADPDVCMCGDFDNDNDVDVDDFYFFLDAYGTCVGDIKYEAAADFDGDGCITLVDYQMWLQCYRDANGGKNFVVPQPKISTKSAGARQAGQAKPR